MKKTKNTYKIYLNGIMNVVMLITIGMIINFVTFGEIENKIVETSYQVLSEVGYNYSTKYIYFGNLTETEGVNRIFEEFEYIKDNKDCKYWAIQWGVFADHYGYDYRYVTVDNHVFTVFYNETRYCIADQLRLRCRDMISSD